MSNSFGKIHKGVLAVLTGVFLLSGCGFTSNQQGNYYLIDENGNRVSKKTYSGATYSWDNMTDVINVLVERKGKQLHGVVGADGDLLFKPVDGDLYIRDDGYIEDEVTGNLYDESGKELELNDEDEKIGLFADNGLACVKGKDGLYGYIDSNYNYVIKKSFSSATKFDENGYASICTNEGKWGVIDASGEFVIQPSYDEIGRFSEGIAGVLCDDGKWRFIDEDGSIAIDDEFDMVYGYGFQDGFALVRKENYTYVINIKGEILAEVDDATKVQSLDGLMIIDNGEGLVGAIDTSGAIVLPYEYTSISKADENGNLIVGQDGFFGIIDRNGNLLVQIKYRAIIGANECGMYPVKDGKDRWGYVNSEGEEAIMCQFEEAKPFSENGLALAKLKDGLYGYIDITGKWKIDPVYSDATVFNSKLGVAIVCPEQD